MYALIMSTRSKANFEAGEVELVETTGTERLRRCFLKTLENKLVGVYVHGSLAFGCFQPQKSDIDAIAVVKESLTIEEKTETIQELLAIWRYAPEKGYEISVVLESVCRYFQHPTPYELHFSKDWIERFQQNPASVCNELPKTDPDLAAHFMVARSRGIVLFGPPAEKVFSQVPESDYLDSILLDCGNCCETVLSEPVSTILNLCRVLSYLKDGRIRSKAEGGQWGLGFFAGEHRYLVEQALKAYQTGRQNSFSIDLCEEFCKCAENLIAQWKKEKNAIPQKKP